MPELFIDGVQRIDEWCHRSDDKNIVEEPFTVSFARWMEERDDLIEAASLSGGSSGIRLTLDDDPLALEADIERFTLIVIEVSDAADGRIFSVASRLRENLSYRHELRVTGGLAVDQLLFMQRCGINAVVLEQPVDMQRFTARYQRFYQTGAALSGKHALIRRARRRHTPAGNDQQAARPPVRSGSKPRHNVIDGVIHPDHS